MNARPAPGGTPRPRRARLAAACLALLALTACTTRAPVSAPPPSAKERYADDLLSIVPPSHLFWQLSAPHAAQYGAPHRQSQAHANFMRNVDDRALNTLLREALLKHFTEDELRALLAFCSTPEGRACMAKAAPFAADVLPACAHEAAQAFRKTAIDAACGRLLP